MFNDDIKNSTSQIDETNYMNRTDYAQSNLVSPVVDKAMVR